MKKLLFTLAILLLTASLLVACGGDTTAKDTDPKVPEGSTPKTDESTPKTEDTTVKTPDTTEKAEKHIYVNENFDGKTLKVLAIGNSFSDDSMEWLYKIAKAEGVEKIVLGNLYWGGCDLQTHYNNAYSETPVARYEYRKNTGDRWITRNNSTIEYGILDEDWDIITMQQVSGKSGLYSTYNPYLEGLVDYVNKTKTNPDCVFAWNMTWAYQSDSNHGDFPNYKKNQQKMYESIVSSVRRVILPREDFPIILTPGTAIQNMRTSFVGDTLTRDGYHLSYDLGRFIAGYTWYAVLTGSTLTELKYTHGFDGETLAAVMEAVNNAVAHPFEVTPSTHTEAPENGGYDLDEYTELKFDYTVGGYWQSDSGDNYNKIVTGAGNSAQFIATELFTKETLPVGSLIVVDSGYQYRPERWANVGVQSGRPGQVTTEFTEVTDAFWDGYKWRAFNISVVGASRNIAESEVVHFRIYVPKGVTVPDIDVSFDEETKPETPEIDLERYELLEFTYTVGGYWNSTDSTNHHKVITGADNSGYFIATESFTRETLPVGSIIIIDEGWQYRPEAWKNDGAQPGNTRPNNVTTHTVEVTEAWWGDYIMRAFNIAVKGNNVSIKNDPDAVTHFRIYVPKA